MLEGHDISILRGERLLFPPLSFQVLPGESLFIKGPNGAGKSTLLRALAGLIPVFNGKILGNPKNELLYIGHKLGLHPEATVKDQVHLWHRFYTLPANSILEGIDAWGLLPSLTKKISHLSEGQRKRLRLSRCTWLPRKIWLLDEPHGGLDAEGRKILETLFQKHPGILVLATHDPLKGSQEIHL